MRNPARERSRNLNREVWESPSVYGGEDVNCGIALTEEKALNKLLNFGNNISSMLKMSENY
ncbi:MAG: hypothetical protein GPJ07_04525 [Microcystis aeruginosa G13-07]|nr:hypothetical protein [Microcystis aeruginosa G13-07]